MTVRKNPDTNRNEGEGNRTAARRYNEAVRGTAAEGSDAGSRVESDDERRELEDAEEVGRRRAKEFDPGVDRDFRKGTK